MAENNHQRTLALRAPRGVLFDRDGRVLVENRHSFSISIVREHTKDLEPHDPAAGGGARRRRGARARDRRAAPPRADLPADRDRRGRDARAGGGGHGAAARLRAARRRRRAGADAAVSRRRMAAHLFGYVGEVSEAQVAERRRPEERRHRRPVGHREGLQRAADGRGRREARRRQQRRPRDPDARGRAADRRASGCS